MWFIHTTEYYSTSKNKEILTYVTTQTDLDEIMVSEINQSQKKKYCMIPLSKTVKLIETESTMVVAKVWGEGEKGFAVQWV